MSAAVARRRKNTLGAVLRAAVRRDLLDRNPLDRVEWRTPSRDLSIDVAAVPSMADVLALVDHVTALDSPGARYGALFAFVGLAGLRPSEAIGLRVDDLELPAEGHGPGAGRHDRARRSLHRRWRPVGGEGPQAPSDRLGARGAAPADARPETPLPRRAVGRRAAVPKRQRSADDVDELPAGLASSPLLRVYAGVLVDERDRSNELIDAEIARLVPDG